MLVKFDEMTRLKCARAGFIPYIKRNGTIYFLLGIDAKSKEIADAGGGIKLNETIISCGIRELIEETKELIQPTDLKQIKYGIYDKMNSNCIIFCEIKSVNLYHTIIKDFTSSEKCGEEYEEMSSLIWLSTDEMIKHVYSDSSRLWKRLKATLSNCGGFDDYLLNKL